MKKFNIQNAKERCKKYRLKILEISQKVQALHLGGAYSCMEIVDLIYCILYKFSNSKLQIDSKDCFQFTLYNHVF